MLMPIQTSGTKPPLFFVHGLRGITFAVGPNFAHALGPNQPVYVINANGMDGRQPVIDDVGEMVLAYYAEIQRARAAGPLRIGAMCSGCLIAIELARRLQEDGRRTGPVILADPPAVPFGYDKRRNSVDFRRPQIAERMYREVRAKLLAMASHGYDDQPFDPADPEQLHAATLAAVGSMVAFARYVPSPFSGPTEMIISAERAPGFFHPMMPWHKLLPGPRAVHVLPCPHEEMFGAAREAVARLIRYILEEEPTSASLVAPEIQPALS
jgi:thioesterase domain-containing protein